MALSMNQAIDGSEKSLSSWPGSKVVTALNQHDDSKLHGRHFTKDYCKDIGLKIVDLEENATFQDAVLTVHHAFMIMLANGPTIKIIENKNPNTIMISTLPIPIGMVGKIGRAHV